LRFAGRGRCELTLRVMQAGAGARRNRRRYDDPSGQGDIPEQSQWRLWGHVRTPPPQVSCHAWRPYMPGCKRKIRGTRRPARCVASLNPYSRRSLRILQEADGPLHVREIHARAETLLGEPVSWTSLKAASASTAAATTPASAGYSAAGTGGRSITGAGEGVTGGLKLAGIRRSSLVAAQDRRPLTSVYAGTNQARHG